MNYKKSMWIGVIVMLLVQTLSVSYALILGRFDEFGSIALPISLTIIVVVGLFGFIPGLIFHAIKNNYSNISSHILGVGIFVLINGLGYVSEDINKPLYDMFFSFIIYTLAGVLYAYLYSKYSIIESA